MEKNLRIGLLFIGILMVAFAAIGFVLVIQENQLANSCANSPGIDCGNSYGYGSPSDNPCPPGQKWFNSDQVPDGQGGCY